MYLLNLLYMAKKVLHIYNEGETYAYRIQNITET